MVRKKSRIHLARLDAITWTNGINATKRDRRDHFPPDNSKHMDSPVIIAAHTQ